MAGRTTADIGSAGSARFGSARLARWAALVVVVRQAWSGLLMERRGAARWC